MIPWGFWKPGESYDGSFHWLTFQGYQPTRPVYTSCYKSIRVRENDLHDLASSYTVYSKTKLIAASQAGSSRLIFTFFLARTYAVSQCKSESEWLDASWYGAASLLN